MWAQDLQNKSHCRCDSFQAWLAQFINILRYKVFTMLLDSNEFYYIYFSLRWNAVLTWRGQSGSPCPINSGTRQRLRGKLGNGVGEKEEEGSWGELRIQGKKKFRKSTVGKYVKEKNEKEPEHWLRAAWGAAQGGQRKSFEVNPEDMG